MLRRASRVYALAAKFLYELRFRTCWRHAVQPEVVVAFPGKVFQGATFQNFVTAA